MNLLVGIIITLVFILGSFWEMGGNLPTLLQPGEMLIILGSSLGGLIIANSKQTLVAVIMSIKRLLRPPIDNTKSYEELMLFLFKIFKQIRVNGIMAIEESLDAPHEGAIFKECPSILRNKKALNFFCDYMRMVIMGFEDYEQLENLMMEEIAVHHSEMDGVNLALDKLGDALPALGIVAAVLGVINSMSSIGAAPEVLGQSIGGALVGTFFGVLLAYGLVNPISQCLRQSHDDCLDYMNCIKIAILSYVKGNAPIITAEFVRKVIPGPYRPSFAQLENLLMANKS